MSIDMQQIAAAALENPETVVSVDNGTVQALPFPPVTAPLVWVDVNGRVQTNDDSWTLHRDPQHSPIRAGEDVSPDLAAHILSRPGLYSTVPVLDHTGDLLGYALAERDHP